MANAYRVQVGDNVSYLSGAPIRWRKAKVTSVSSQTSLVLAIVNLNGTRTALNSGSPVAKRTAATQTNIWRPY